MRISDWSSDVCSSDLSQLPSRRRNLPSLRPRLFGSLLYVAGGSSRRQNCRDGGAGGQASGVDPIARIEPVRSDAAQSRFRSEEHTSELQSLMRISYAVFCLKKKKHNDTSSYSRYTYCTIRPIPTAAEHNNMKSKCPPASHATLSHY